MENFCTINKSRTVQNVTFNIKFTSTERKEKRHLEPMSLKMALLYSEKTQKQSFAFIIGKLRARYVI
ncbi:hypothetical protein NL53_03360 [Vibrio variabilis]|uniref:Uncharacterized protein n=2 Tax=Vibrio TaxID=662 RepID=A0ABR4YGD8_9VIBR|nr:hypothetical protein NL53_03360 [Vibrio variabilis]KHD26394.1 hypothetical protein NM09_03160 [Vibrio caribbeanicus]